MHALYFQPNHMIHSRSLAPEASLEVGKKVVGFNESNPLLTMCSIVWQRQLVNAIG